MPKKAGKKTKCKYCPNSYVDVPGHVQRQHRDKIQDVRVTNLPEDDDNTEEELCRQFARAGRIDRLYVNIDHVHVQRQHPNKIQEEDMDGDNNSLRSRTPTTPIAKAGSKRNISDVENGTSSTAIKKNELACTDFVNEKPGDRV
uniref:RRM domain-containing protein n=1 Tax=Panagrolaimus davidi TaxID=227884 RepID=A0A914QCT7_9BILA